jgi:hypothetical protein
MKRKIIIIISAIVFLSAASCISQFTPDIVTQDRYLTVDGLITDSDMRYQVKLTLSRPLEETAPEAPAKGASVSVVDGGGHSWQFTETKPGIYMSDSTLFRGVAGETYTLLIAHDGKQYESSPCLLRAAPPVDTLTHEIYDREINAAGDKETVVRVALHTVDPDGESHYFRWTFLETWEIRLTFNLLSYEKRVCWTSEESHAILVATTEALSEDRISDFTMTVFNNETDRGQNRYSMLVNQYSISREEYEFWDNVKRVSESTGGLYDVIPAAVPGNVKCISDPAELVLGYFSVSGISNKRIFIKNPLYVPDLYIDKCTYESVPAGIYFPGLGLNAWAIHEYSIDDGPLRWIITLDEGCTDCGYFASKVKPDYWDAGFYK